ncbi:type IX secretion system membrane protein PorP/SprF [Chitinophaga oryziterrae]|uniref:Type IX secretion system membrane protein PorP/SprF n=1 Tax=Chitinophaga oryziterrae TaxID=1031224 RepID=A0A6N8J4T0_9BACT|nr:type IX secretion system membrane protein PorP/SprF [Chitinophaga oryziterrae]MVT40043.1 type IX secretion system membrane protein PorP/SprF [Chitinophaga oryziterrae]
MKKILLITGLSLVLGFKAKAQQDAQYSQYMFNGIYINPAYAGYKEQLNLHSFYRTQWTGVPGAPKSFSLAVDAIANDGNVGLAFQVASDKLGAQSNLSAYGSYAYRIRLNPDGSSRLALGLSVGVMQTGLNASLLTTNDPETDMPAGTQNKIAPDARAGVFYSDNRFYAGLSFDNLIVQYINSHSTYVPQTKLHYYVTAGMLVAIDENFQLKPSFLLKDDLGGPTSLDLNTFLMYKEIIWLGGSYRSRVNIYDKSYLQKNLLYRNAVVAAVELFPVKGLRVAYAYDFSIGPLQGYSSGTHEISVGFTFNKQNLRMATPRVF